MQPLTQKRNAVTLSCRKEPVSKLVVFFLLLSSRIVKYCVIFWAGFKRSQISDKEERERAKKEKNWQPSVESARKLNP